MSDTLTIEVYKQRNRSKTAKDTPANPGYNRHRLRWRGKAANGEKVANGGAAYVNLGDLVGELFRLWPGQSGAHVQVKFEGRTVPLAEAHTLHTA